MRKTMVRIFAVVLVLAMAIGFLAMIPASAATEPVQIMAHNVYFDEYLQIMYAVYIPNGVTIDKIELTDGKNTFEAVKFDQQPVIEGKTCQAYVAANGVSLQAIDTVVTAKVYVDGQVVAEDQYSILQYIRKRLYVEEVTGDWKDLCTNLLATAESLQTVLPGETVTVNNYGYVYVENGTVNGNSDAIFVNGTVLTKDMLAVPYGTATEWTYQIVGGDTGVLGEEGLAIGTNNIILTATKIDESTDPTDPVEPENANRYYIATNRSTGNYFYMTSNLGTGGTKRYTAVDSGLTELPTAITTPETGYVFVLEENGDGTYSIYAEGVEGNNYLGWTSGNSGTLVEKSSAKILTVDKTEGGLYNIHFTNNSEERYLSLNGTSGNNYFAWYTGTQRQDLVLIPVVSEGGEVPTDPTEPEVTEPEETTTPTEPETELVADGVYAIVANNNAALGTVISNNKISGVSVTVSDNVATGAGDLGWTVINVSGGVTLSYNGRYLAHTSSTNLGLQDAEYVWGIVEGENGCYQLNSQTENRALLYRKDTGIFGGYATSNIDNTTYFGNLQFCEFKACEHKNTTVKDAKTATCGAEGYTGDTVCNDCGATVATGAEIPATGNHSYQEGYCVVCNGEDPDYNQGGGSGEEKTPKWVLVKNISQLNDGDKVVIVNIAAQKAMSTAQNTNNRGSTSVSINGDIIDTVGSDVQQITMVKNGDYWNFEVSTGKYLYAASTSSNHLKTGTSTTNNNAKWTIAIASDGVATIKANQNARNWLRFNKSNNPNLFSCYTSGQENVAIFVLTTDY